MIDEQLANYFLGELTWELEQFNMPWPGGELSKPEQIEVLSYSSNVLSFRVKDATFDALLSWRGDVAPVITQVTDPPS